MRAGSRWCQAFGLVAALLLLPSQGRAQVSVNIILHQPYMQTFYVADFMDLARESIDTSMMSDLFTVVIHNTPVTAREVSLKVTLRIENLATLQLGGSTLAWAQSQPFTIEASEMLQISNRDLGQEGSRFSIDSAKSDFDQETGEMLQDLILQTGLLPSCTFIFDVTIHDEFEVEIAFDTRSIIVSNPSRVDLVGPGTEFGGSLPVIATDTPQFFWSTDAFASGFSRFRIRVVKVEGAASAEEAMQGYATWEKIVEDQTTEIYPSSVEAIALEAGQTYAWQVERLVETSSGIHELQSDIFWFKLEDPSAGVIGAGVEEEVSTMIAMILDLQGLSSELEGYQPTGMVLVDGRPTDLNTLRNLFEQVLSGQIQIATIIIR